MSMAMGVCQWSVNLKLQLNVMGKKIVETVLETQGEGCCLLASPASKKLQVLKVGPDLVKMTTVHSIGRDINGIVGRVPKVFSGVGKLSGYQLELHINREVTPVARKPRRIPLPFERECPKNDSRASKP